MTVTEITTRLTDLKTSIDSLAAAIAARPVNVATQADLDAIGAGVDAATAALAGIPPQT